MWKFCTLSILIVMLLSSCDPAWDSSTPPIHLNPNMDKQEKYKSQEESSFFADKRTMRTPVKGTIPRKFNIHTRSLEKKENYSITLNDGYDSNNKLIKELPLEASKLFKNKKQMLEIGKKNFQIYCTPCHGTNGHGDGIITTIGGVEGIPDLHSYRIKNAPAGSIFRAIRKGVNKGNMPSYATQISVKDSWAVVKYLKTLQNKKNDGK